LNRLLIALSDRNSDQSILSLHVFPKIIGADIQFY